ncbi:hypothetical protein CONLIGDRAFT_283921 [Coniochaeta ligniaria NRRL 30616]|uniref:Uncharacterized protein n=1 Tax=Coniochaeta ligniaria NRRL 30616 TaxID=1408157 RepID=A0A1J7ISV0_9PEZI|nr:hypothetical protein CONLIGDRAFT_283921 [Coniochaeta ligniaria NRRL 30616]
MDPHTFDPWHPSYHDHESHLFYRLALLPHVHPCPRCFPSTSLAIQIAESEAVQQGFDPRRWRGGPNRLCPRHTIAFFQNIASQGVPVGLHPTPEDIPLVRLREIRCPGCFRPDVRIDPVFLGTIEPRRRRSPFFASPVPWYRPFTFCAVCGRSYLRDPARFMQHHSNRVAPADYPTAERPAREASRLRFIPLAVTAAIICGMVLDGRGSRGSRP